MILVDSGVLIDFLKTKDPKLDKQFRTLAVAICGVKRAEILAGARSAKDRQRLMRFLARFHQALMAESCWELVGDNRAALYAAPQALPGAAVSDDGLPKGSVMALQGLHFPGQGWTRMARINISFCGVR